MTVCSWCGKPYEDCRSKCAQAQAYQRIQAATTADRMTAWLKDKPLGGVIYRYDETRPPRLQAAELMRHWHFFAAVIPAELPAWPKGASGFTELREQLGRVIVGYGVCLPANAAGDEIAMLTAMKDGWRLCQRYEADRPHGGLRPYPCAGDA